MKCRTCRLIFYCVRWGRRKESRAYFQSRLRFSPSHDRARSWLEGRTGRESGGAARGCAVMSLTKRKSQASPSYSAGSGLSLCPAGRGRGESLMCPVPRAETGGGGGVYSERCGRNGRHRPRPPLQGKMKGGRNKAKESRACRYPSGRQSLSLTVRPFQGILGPLEIDRHDGDGSSSRGSQP